MLTNELRNYFGIRLIKDSWKSFPVSGMSDSYVLVDDDNCIQKFILTNNDGEIRYREIDYSIPLTTDAKILGKNGKSKPLSFAVLSKLKPDNKYFDVTEHSIILKNTDNGVVLFEETNLNWKSEKEVHEFLLRIATKPNAFEKEEIKQFLSLKKISKQKINQGDIFRFKVAQNRFVYGRIISNLSKFLSYNTGLVSEWEIDLRGRCLFDSILWPQIWIDFFLLITDNPYLKAKDFSNVKTTPSIIQSAILISNNTYKIIDNSSIEENSYDVPMDLDTYFQYKPICHIFRWGASVVAFKPIKRLEQLAKLTYPIPYNDYHSKNKELLHPIEGFVKTSIHGETNFSYITDRGDLREPLLQEVRKIISENLDFDITGDYNEFVKRYGFMTTKSIFEFANS